VGETGPGAAGFDYDELARRLLVQVVRRLAAADPGADPPEASPAPDQPASPDQLALQETVSGLEYELATAWTKHGKLAEENVRLREQLKAAQRSLALAAEQVRRLPPGMDLNDSEVVLLQQLLAPPPAADSTDDSDAEAPSLLG
jgi:small-conductance mechanosensitive channel